MPPAPAQSESWLDVFEPATGARYAQCPDGDADDVEAAVAAAQAAFPAWSSLPADQRARWLERLADALEARIDEFAAAESRDAGKPLALARDIEIPRAVSNLRFFAPAAMQFASESHHGEAGLNYTLRQPLGVVGCISPWNLPLYLFTWKIAPALAAGNTVVAKPSEVTPLTACDARRTRRARSASRPACSTSCTGSGPKVGAGHRGASRGQGDQLHRQHRGRHAHRRAVAPASSRRCRWNSAARTRPWSSPTRHAPA